MRNSLQAVAVSEIHKRVEDLKGIQGAQVAYNARINMESVIALSGTQVAQRN